MGVEIKSAAAKSGKSMSDAEVALAAEKSIRAMMLIRTYRVRGHLGANLDPLGLSKLEEPADLNPEYHGFTAADMDQPVYLGGVLGFETVGGAANFVLSRVGDGVACFEALQKRGIIVRPLGVYGLPEYVRITIGRQEENERLLSSFADLLESGEIGTAHD